LSIPPVRPRAFFALCLFTLRRASLLKNPPEGLLCENLNLLYNRSPSKGVSHQSTHRQHVSRRRL